VTPNLYLHTECTTRPELLERLTRAEDELSKLNTTVVLSWVLSHSDIENNEIFDKLAKETAYNTSKGRLPIPGSAAYEDAVTISMDIAKNSRQRKWNHDSAGM